MPENNGFKEKSGYSRRDFLKVLGTSSAVAAAGCAQELPEKLIPYVVQPDEVIPGVATWYAGSCAECDAGCGVVVRTREGRAVKVEGNSEHPINHGGLCAQGQSSLQTLYDPDRIREPLKRDVNGVFTPIKWKDAVDSLTSSLKSNAAESIVITGPVSGSLEKLLGEFAAKVPNAKIFEIDISDRELQNRAASEVFGANSQVHYDLTKADVILNFGADFLETWLSPVELASAWSSRRSPERSKKVGASGISYFYHVEPRLSLTAGNADKWVMNAPGSEALILAAILNEVVKKKGSDISLSQQVKDITIEQASKASGVSAAVLNEMVSKLLKAKGSVVLAGGASIAGDTAHETVLLSHLLNVALGNIGKTLVVRNRQRTAPIQGLSELKTLVAEIKEGKKKLGTVIVHGVDPLFTLPTEIGLKEALSKAQLLVNLGTNLDNTANFSQLVLPVSTNFESWSDSQPTPGVFNLNQPAMTPLYQTQSFGDSLIAVLQGLDDGYKQTVSFLEYIKKQWKARTGEAGFEQRWDKYVQDGGDWSERLADDSSAPKVKISTPIIKLSVVAPTKSILAYSSVNSFDGRSANRPWIQELPNPTNSIVWGTWIEVNADKADALGFKRGDVVQVRTATGVIEAPVYPTKHIHPDLVAVPVGQGHDSLGRYARGVGANPLQILKVNSEQPIVNRLVATVGELQRSIAHEELVVLSGSDSQAGRGITRVAFASKLAASEEHHEHNGHHENGHAAGHHDPLALGPQPEPKQMYEQMEHPLYRWAMTVDLASCTGCSACVVACYAENNVPVVGKDLCAQGREMGWIRIERYLDGDEDQPVSGFVPMMCQHCGNAPCEPVCPVYATYHNEEGLNSMVYNRCVGTRYCLNNCSYKVRRFNWFRYYLPEPLTWQLNPDVTVREVGVMEKCTFCVQRIAEGKNNAKNEGRIVADGEVQPACASSCPTKAITFGNLNNSESQVAKLGESARSYKVLDAFINTQPAVTYLARVKNDIV
jgi:anaerobic selenocysteine-containing dehydrogenase/Fe-S-cluster-containing dehydrogenase component